MVKFISVCTGQARVIGSEMIKEHVLVYVRRSFNDLEDLQQAIA
jgi:hypothetical protein